MNKIELTGIIHCIHDQEPFLKDGKKYEYKTVVLQLNDNRKVAANIWNDKIQLLDTMKAGDMVVIDLNISSEPNAKLGQGVYYHKLNIKTINHYDSALFRQP